MPSQRHQSADCYADGEVAEHSPVYESSIQFAPNVTPSSYPTVGNPASPAPMPSTFMDATQAAESDPLRPPSPEPGSEDDPMAHYAWFEAHTGQRKKKNRRMRENPNHIPRPPNSFMIFRRWYITKRQNTPVMDMSGTNLSRMIGDIWKGLPAHEQAKWNARSLNIAKEHGIRYPGYKFEPHHDKEKKEAKRASRAVNKKSGASRASGSRGSVATVVPAKGKKAVRQSKSTRRIMSNPSPNDDSPTVSTSSSMPSSVMPSPAPSTASLAPAYYADPALGPMQIPAYHHSQEFGTPASTSPIDLHALNVPAVPHGGLVAPQARHPLPQFYAPAPTAPMDSWVGGNLRRSSSVPGLAEYAAQQQHQHHFQDQYHSNPLTQSFSPSFQPAGEFAPLSAPLPVGHWLPHGNAYGHAAGGELDFAANAYTDASYNVGSGLNAAGSGFVDLGDRRLSLFHYGREINGRRPSTAAPAYPSYYPQLENATGFQYGHGNGTGDANGGVFYPNIDQGLNAHADAGLYIPPFAPAPIEHRTNVAPGIFADNYSLGGATANPFLVAPAPTTAPYSHSELVSPAYAEPTAPHADVSGVDPHASAAGASAPAAGTSSPTGERNSFDFNAMSAALVSSSSHLPALTVDPNYASAACAPSPSELPSAVNSASSAASFQTLTTPAPGATWDPYSASYYHSADSSGGSSGSSPASFGQHAYLPGAVNANGNTSADTHPSANGNINIHVNGMQSYDDYYGGQYSGFDGTHYYGQGEGYAQAHAPALGVSLTDELRAAYAPASGEGNACAPDYAAYAPVPVSEGEYGATF